MIGDWLTRVRRDNSGSVVVEFAIIGPTMLAMMLGVFQIGIGMQNYNAMRSIAAETARHAIVNYQTGNKLSNSQLADHAKTVNRRAKLTPYRRAILTPSDCCFGGYPGSP